MRKAREIKNPPKNKVIL